MHSARGKGSERPTAIVPRDCFQRNTMVVIGFFCPILAPALAAHFGEEATPNTDYGSRKRLQHKSGPCEFSALSGLEVGLLRAMLKTGFGHRNCKPVCNGTIPAEAEKPRDRGSSTSP